MTIAAVASGGGHFIELLRLQGLLREYDTIYISTNPAFSHSVDKGNYYTVADGSRWNKTRMMKIAWQVFRIFLKHRPDIIISTGAAPGAVAIVVGKLMGAKTVWIESLCHVEKISMSGKYVSRFSDQFYTQWPHLATEGIIYKGNIIA
jgi:UDP-N-acetylglucosamine:LPS N-acetylglucosamine transferase